MIHCILIEMALHSLQIWRSFSKKFHREELFDCCLVCLLSVIFAPFFSVPPIAAFFFFFGFYNIHKSPGIKQKVHQGLVSATLQSLNILSNIKKKGSDLGIFNSSPASFAKLWGGCKANCTRKSP